MRRPERGDPQVHDHVLLANFVRMGDERGGWKGLDTGLLRDHLHAATAVGRMAAAAKAVELGYGIEADPGPSGRLGGWAIAGIPKEAWEVHATRSAQIEAAVGPDASYRSRSVAARATRDRKGHDQVEDLVPAGGTSWPGWLPAARAGSAVERAGLAYEPPGLDILDDLAAELLGPGGRLASEKTFTRGDVVVAVAPHLHGLPVSYLDGAVETVLSHEHAVALPRGGRRPGAGVGGGLRARGRAPHRRPGRAPCSPGRAGHRARRGRRRCPPGRAVRGLPSQPETGRSGPGPSHLGPRPGLGDRGGRVSGKTSTLSAVRAGFEAAGYTGARGGHFGPGGQGAGRGRRRRLPHGGLAHLAPGAPPGGPQPAPRLVLDEGAR